MKYGIAGGLAGAALWLYSHPFDTLKTIIQTNDISQKTIRQKELIKKFMSNGYLHGVIDIYRGGFPSLISQISSCGLFFIFYEKIKNNLFQK